MLREHSQILPSGKIARATPLPLNALWIGPELDILAGACLASFVEMGHAVRLYTYDVLRGVPPGVTVADAAQILPRDRVIIQKKTGSFALFSDRFRYEVLRLNCGGWIDCDLLCLRPIESSPYIFGWEESGLINGAILNLPPESDILVDLQKIFETYRWIPPWQNRRDRLRQRWRYWFKPGYSIADMDHIIAGPRAITYFCCKYGLIDRVAARDVFYPVNWRDLDIFFQNARDINRFLTPYSLCVHLWNTNLKREFKVRTPAKGSFLARVVDGSWRDAIERFDWMSARQAGQ
jgi:hypothetical protein